MSNVCNNFIHKNLIDDYKDLIYKKIGWDLIEK